MFFAAVKTCTFYVNGRCEECALSSDVECVKMRTAYSDEFSFCERRMLMWKGRLCKLQEKIVEEKHEHLCENLAV